MARCRATQSKMKERHGWSFTVPVVPMVSWLCRTAWLRSEFARGHDLVGILDK
jgi:hypothetical protein